MPSIHDPIPSHFKAYRLVAIHVKDKFSRFFTVPEFEVGIVKSGWRGVQVEVATTADIAHIEDDAQSVFQRLCARYGAEVVQRYHPGPQRLSEDMCRCAERTAEWMQTAIKAEAEQERLRIAADRAARVDQARLADETAALIKADVEREAAHAADLAAAAASRRLAEAAPTAKGKG